MTPTARPRTFEVADPGAHGVRGWEDHNAVALVGLSCRVPATAPFRAREVNLQLDRVHLARVQGSPHAVARDRATVARRPADSVVVYAALRGEGVWEAAGHRHVLRPGQVVVCDVDRPFGRRFARGLDELVVKVPRAALAGVADEVDLDVPVVLDTAGPGADPHARALVRMAGRALGAADVPAADSTVVELVSVLATRGRVGLPAAHRAVAHAFVAEHLTDPSLSAADVARGTGISERHLSRLFAETGSSVPQYVLARRLELAHARLHQPVSPGTRIVDVAAACGFTSSAYFADAFKRRFGATAGEVRRAATDRPPDFRRRG